MTSDENYTHNIMTLIVISFNASDEVNHRNAQFKIPVHFKNWFLIRFPTLVGTRAHARSQGQRDLI